MHIGFTYVYLKFEIILILLYQPKPAWSNFGALYANETVCLQSFECEITLYHRLNLTKKIHPMFFTYTNTHTLCVTPLANLLTGSRSEWIDAEGVWQQWIVGNCRESNESPPDGLLPGIATHLWLLFSRCPGNSSAWWETIILSKCVCVQACVFISILKAKLFIIDLDPLKSEVYSATRNSKGMETALKRSFFLFVFQK